MTTEHQRLRTPAAAAHCGLRANYLEKLRVFGGGPLFISLGRRGPVLYDSRDLDEWLEARKCRSTSECPAT